MGPYKPLRNRVDDHPLLYGNNGSLDPSTCGTVGGVWLKVPSLVGWKELSSFPYPVVFNQFIPNEYVVMLLRFQPSPIGQSELQLRHQ